MTVPVPGNLADLDVEPGGGQGGTSDLAKLMAAAITKAAVNPTPGEEGATLQPNVVEPDTSAIIIEPTPEEKAAQEAAAAAAAAQQPQEGVEPPVETVPIEEIEGALAEAGIDLGISAKDVPKELMPAYEKLLENAVEVAQNILSRELAASDARRQIEDFGKRLQEAPDKLMMALAVNQPEVFNKVSALIAEMNTDPRIKDSVLRELASEARLAEAQRRETLMEEQVKRTKANQVIAATKRAARQYSVDYNTAEKIVALAVQANGGDLDVAEVDGIVQELTGLNRARAAAVTAGKVITPAKAAAVKGAPAGPAAGTGAAPVAVQPGKPVTPATPAASPGLLDGSSRREGGGGVFRSLIKNINARIREA